MKILVLSTCYPRRKAPQHGIFIHRQIRALVDLGADCHVLQPVDWAPPAPLHLLHPSWRYGRLQQADMVSEVEGIPVHHPRVYHPRPSRFFPGDYWDRVGHSILRYVELRPRLRSADLLYAHFLCNEGYAGLVAARELGMPLVAIARGDDVHAWPVRWPDRKPKLASVLKEADGLLASSHGLARDAAQWATDGLKRTITTVYNGIDCERFSPVGGSEKIELRRRLGLPQVSRLLLSVATPIVAKGWLEVLDAFALLKETADDLHLVMAGAPRAADDLNLLTEARTRGLEGRVHWLGCLSPDAMPGLYRASDLFVLASHNEGLSNSMIEAMASGLPVVVTDVGGHAEIVKNTVSGLLVEPHSVESLAAALGWVLADPATASRLGAAARARAIQVGDHRQNAAELLRYFERVISGKSVQQRETIAV